jgi:hypothetical protein
MASEWRELTIGNLCDAGIAIVQTGPFGSQLHAEDYRPNGGQSSLLRLFGIGKSTGLFSLSLR